MSPDGGLAVPAAGPGTRDLRPADTGQEAGTTDPDSTREAAPASPSLLHLSGSEPQKNPTRARPTSATTSKPFTHREHFACTAWPMRLSRHRRRGRCHRPTPSGRQPRRSRLRSRQRLRRRKSWSDCAERLTAAASIAVAPALFSGRSSTRACSTEDLAEVHGSASTEAAIQLSCVSRPGQKSCRGRSTSGCRPGQVILGHRREPIWPGLRVPALHRLTSPACCRGRPLPAAGHHRRSMGARDPSIVSLPLEQRRGARRRIVGMLSS